MPAQLPDHYAVLGVDSDSTFAVIQKVFFKKSLSCHPDKRGKSEAEEAHKEYVIISAAYNVLKDPVSRRKYDHARAWQATQQTANQDSDSEDASEHPASQFPGKHESYTDKAERDARRRQRQQARNASREESKRWETRSGPSDWGYGFYRDSEDTDEAKPFQPYEGPHHNHKNEFSPEEETWLRYRTAKNNLQGLSFSLRDALYKVLDVIRSLRKVEAVTRQAAKARDRLRLIEVYFTSIQLEMEAVYEPSCLMEGTVTRIKKMVILDENIQEFLTMLKDRPPGLSPPEQEATKTSKLLLKAMGQWGQLCR